MKISAHDNTRRFIMVSESTEDLFKIGRLSERLNGSRVYPELGGAKRLEVDFSILLETLLK